MKLIMTKCRLVWHKVNKSSTGYQKKETNNFQKGGGL